MTVDNANKIVRSVESFVRTQLPDACEVIFGYEKNIDGTATVQLRKIFVREFDEPFAYPEQLHEDGLSKMQNFLGENLAVFIESPYVMEFPTENTRGLVGVAMSNSSDRDKH